SQAWRNAMPPDAQAPSTFVHGMFGRPSWSATMPASTSLPFSGPLMKLPRYSAPMRLRSIPASTSASAAACTPSCSIGVDAWRPKTVEPIPAISTSRILVLLGQDLAKTGLEDLPVVVLRQAVDEPVLARTLEPGNVGK